jgi:hypothetical protein
MLLLLLKKFPAHADKQPIQSDPALSVCNATPHDEIMDAPHDNRPDF